ncbi:MAG: NADH-quinone oxidoreductase subunit NuoE [bacterium]|nr:NADH-quinone oxidoreductase subunit NuoE [bacterium]
MTTIAKDLSVVDKILAECGKNEGAAIPILQKAQTHFGYLPEEVMEYIAEKSDIKATQLYGVATFYKQFRFTPVGKYLIKVCHGTACHVKGAGKITQSIEEDLRIISGDTTDDNLFTLESVACLGCCSLAPVISINDKIYGNLNNESVLEVIKKYRSEMEG